MVYRLQFTPGAKRDVRRLDARYARRIVQKLQELAEHAEAAQHKALVGQWKGLYSLRVGDYRALYLLKRDQKLLVVETIGHRREIYDK